MTKIQRNLIGQSLDTSTEQIEECYAERDRLYAWFEMEELHELWDSIPERDWREEVNEYLSCDR